jgi:hypothetical protein
LRALSRSVAGAFAEFEPSNANFVLRIEENIANPTRPSIGARISV